jgi:hypothetical protein
VAILWGSGRELKDFAKFGEMQRKIFKTAEKVPGGRKATDGFASDGNKTIRTIRSHPMILGRMGARF